MILQLTWKTLWSRMSMWVLIRHYLHHDWMHLKYIRAGIINNVWLLPDKQKENIYLVYYTSWFGCHLFSTMFQSQQCIYLNLILNNLNPNKSQFILKKMAQVPLA